MKKDELIDLLEEMDEEGVIFIDCRNTTTTVATLGKIYIDSNGDLILTPGGSDK